MSSTSRLTGSTKPSRALNVNSVYPGRTTVNSGRAAGPLGNKNALQTLGKTTTVVRRMPPPATLPSLKAEHRQESGINLVAQTGGQGWNKSTDSSSDTKNQLADNSLPSGGTPDLRPTWAKNSMGVISTVDQSQVAATTQTQRKPGQLSNNREFPTLAASVAAATNKQSAALVQANASVTEPQKQQQVYSRPESIANEQDQEEPIIPVPPPPASGSNYIGASSRRDINQKLPERFYAGNQESRPGAQRKYDVRKALAQLSMESKDSPSTPTEKSSGTQSDRQSSVPTVPENATPNVELESANNLLSQQHQNASPSTAMPQPLMQKDLSQMHGRAGQEVRSQDVRQYYPHSGPPMPVVQPLNELPETAAWNRAAAKGGYENEYGYRNDVPSSPNVPTQPYGRGDSGPVYRNQQPVGQQRGPPPRLGAGQHPAQRSRYDYGEEGHPPPLMGQRFGSNASWEDYANGGAQNWNMPDERMQRQSNNRGSYRGDSRGNSESESGWYANQQQVPPHQRRSNDPNGWNYSLNEYDSYHQGTQQTGAGSNRSRTTSNSYGDDYEQQGGMYPPYSADNDRRYKGRPKPVEERPYDYPEEYDRQKYHDYEMHQQQPAYRMLKRNDEKSAEYFGNHGQESELLDEDSIALSQITRLGRSSKPINFGSINSDSADIASSDTFDSSIEQRKTLQQGAQQKFNRAPGSGKPPQERQPDNSSQQHSSQKSTISPAVETNVWKKRMDEQKQKQQEDKNAWQNTKQHRKVDYFPPISDKKSDLSEPEPLIPQTHSRSHNKPHHLTANQRAPSKWDDPPLSWNEEYQGEQNADDDTYDGTRREFFNRQRGQQRQQNQPNPRNGQKSSGPREGGDRRQPSTQQQQQQQPPVRRKRNEPEDSFSNMDEFHAEDYKIEEVRAHSNQSSQYDNGFDGKSQKEEKRQNAPRKMMDSDKRQLKPQRTSGARMWQRQPQGKNLTEEQAGDDEQTGDSEKSTQQRSSNLRNQQRTNQSGGQTRPQQQQQNQSKRNNIRPVKNLTPQSAEQVTAKSVKSPARSENGGGDEWETASESSDLHGRKNEAAKKFGQTRPKAKEKTPRDSNGTTKSAANDGQSTITQRSNAGQKNDQPRQPYMSQNNDGFVKNRSELKNQPQQYKNDSKKNARNNRLNKDTEPTSTKTVNGLAGSFDINSASVVIIDQTPSNGPDSTSDNGEFEEVISRKVKRERQKQEQRQRLREEKQQQRKSTNKKSSKSQSNEKPIEEDYKEAQQLNDQVIKPLSSISPISATDSGVAAISSVSPPQLAPENEQSSVQTHVSVSIPPQQSVWNFILGDPSPKVPNPTTNLSDDEPVPQTTSTIKPIARPKQRIDREAKMKIPQQNEMSAFGGKGLEGSNYSFNYEHSITNSDDHIELTEKLNMAKIKDFWPGETDNYIGNSLFKKNNNATNDVQSSKAQTPTTEDNQKVTERELNEEVNQSKSRSSVNRQYSNNSQSSLNTSTAMLFGGHNSVVYPLNSTNPYNPVSNYSTLLSDNSVRDFLNGPPFTSSPPVQALPPNQGFVPPHPLNYITTNGPTNPSNNWPINNTDLLNTINSTSPLHIPPNAFNTNVPATVPIHQQPMPLNYNVNVPPPSIGKFAPNFPPPAQDFRFPPPPRTNYASGNGRNQPPNFTNAPPPQLPLNNGNRSSIHQQQRRPSHNSNGRQNSSPIVATPPFFMNNPWNGNMKSNNQQTFGLF